jgi:hypothetical protein
MYTLTGSQGLRYQLVFRYPKVVDTSPATVSHLRRYVNEGKARLTLHYHRER